MGKRKNKEKFEEKTNKNEFGKKKTTTTTRKRVCE